MKWSAVGSARPRATCSHWRSRWNAGALDAACFHAQQAAEKYLKAYLTQAGTDFPPTHNLVKLVILCRGSDDAFDGLVSIVEPLTPYAVDLRYDAEFWPSAEAARQAQTFAKSVQEFVVQRIQARG
jgi:HEPN domain-containing protein